MHGLDATLAEQRAQQLQTPLGPDRNNNVTGFQRGLGGGGGDDLSAAKERNNGGFGHCSRPCVAQFFSHKR